MRLPQRNTYLAAWALSLGAHAYSPAFGQVQDLGSTFNRSAFASQISANGRVVVGGTLFANSFFEQPFRFTDDGGFQILPPLNGVYGGATGISNDGTVIVGTIGSGTAAVRWIGAGEPLELGSLGGSSTFATAISGDGSTIAGAGRASATSPHNHAFRWTESGGMVDIHPSFATSASWAEDVSLDGSVVVGYASRGPSSTGGATTTAFLWSAATGGIDLGAGVADYAVATDVSDDGSVVVGRGTFGTSRFQPFVWTAASGMVPLGEIGTGQFYPDVTVSADGSTVIGACSPVGFRWTQGGGLQTFTGAAWFHPTSLSHDGEKLAGYLEVDQFSVVAATWTAATGVTLLPGPSGADSVARGMSADGTSVVGSVPSSSGSRAARWRTDGTIGEPFCDPAVANSVSATGAYLTLGGSNQTDDQALELNVTDLPLSTFGFFLVSRARAVILNPAGSQGTLCLGASIGRFVGPGQIKNSGAQGAFSLTVDPRTFPSASGPVLPSFGETWHFQAWYRDANPGVTSNFSSAASVPIY